MDHYRFKVRFLATTPEARRIGCADERGEAAALAAFAEEVFFVLRTFAVPVYGYAV